eukprot:gene12013-2597_t
MILLLLSVLVACVGSKEITCNTFNEGLIVSGNVCNFECCLSLSLREMLLIDDSGTKGDMALQEASTKNHDKVGGNCPPFAKKGKSCNENGHTYPHKAFIEYDDYRSRICNNVFPPNKAKMILLLLSVLVACVGSEETTCNTFNEGLIVSGNVCHFECCLSQGLREMQLGGKALQEASTKNHDKVGGICAPFSENGNSCNENGHTYPHKAFIEYDDFRGRICNNGKIVEYDRLKSLRFG